MAEQKALIMDKYVVVINQLRESVGPFSSYERANAYRDRMTVIYGTADCLIFTLRPTLVMRMEK